MKTLNKNWFAFTLIAVIFALLGFLFGKMCHPQNDCMMKKHSKCHMPMESHHALSIHPIDSIIQSHIEIEEGVIKGSEKVIKIEVQEEKE